MYIISNCAEIIYRYTEMCDEAHELSQTDKHLHSDL